jgi:DNA-directed RNA polymerase subunit M/transcription elongation factor TFIIS
MQKHHPDVPSSITPSKNNSSTSLSPFQNSSEMTQHTVGSPDSADSSSITSFSTSSSVHKINTHDESSSEPSMPISAESSQSVSVVGNAEIFECKECSMKFLSSQLLSEHSVEHTGERPYECEICGVKFTHKFALRSHKLSHDAEYSQNLKEKLSFVQKHSLSYRYKTQKFHYCNK